MLLLLTCVAGTAVPCAVGTLTRGQVTAGTGPVRYASIEEAACPHNTRTKDLLLAQYRQDQFLI